VQPDVRGRNLGRALSAGRTAIGISLELRIHVGGSSRTLALSGQVVPVNTGADMKTFENGRLRSTVDVAHASYTNAVGDTTLTAFWRDPDFSADEHAFYYARVIEILTPRWNVYDALRLGTEVLREVPTEVQGRAYTSPIWFTP